MCGKFNKIESLKKADLHRHIEGAVAPEAIYKLYRKSNNGQKVKYFRKKMVLTRRAKSLDKFIDKLGTRFMKKYAATIDDLIFVFKQGIRDAALDNVNYLELRFALSNFLDLETNPAVLVKKINLAIEEESKKQGIITKLLITLKRDDDKSINFKIVKLAKGLYKSGDIAGLDLAGNEHFYPNNLFVEMAKEIKKAEIPLTVHAGEVTNAESVATAVNHLFARRIGHGTRAAFDKSVMELLVRKNILLEVCPTSNLDTSAYKTYEEVPIRTLLDNKVPIIICTDDPVTSNINLSWEVNNLIKRKIITPEEYERMLISAQSFYFNP
ncbi:MAG: Adenosine deaminase [Candidatus Woesebacteria bacterium GW2011_GWB1_43_14]|uniref:adenosine deaminase n=1 Tax=Candidatus Woesebacteria bacterium GW2011_GWB1_43_14 TaxID=1618578 RepID=A0A0G1FQN5_9BACT|nr:MAG: Adenosine deaminase [Candidatus Woesebacteria bacterium GW2011_GWA1_39_11b]KKS78074.1 MAG: Adenosine deaminase [Candidatus Woesebacteria bacterium GW2011_GWC1_42_9]KKS97346.1 MAG: Adenosine deaminase [Candidatus Woesebacteria bacterium GW2011_GWB1_43_14]